MFVIGITGGIGSGKSAVTKAFAALGIDIVDADVAARIVVESGKPALKKIAQHFGDAVLQSDGTLNRAALRDIVFRDQTERHWLEQLLHPLIAEEVHRQLQAAESAYVIYVSPLLIENSHHAFCNRVLVVDVPEETQVQRTMLRDNNDADQVQRIIASQADRQQRLARADDIIDNSRTLEQLQQKVAALHNKYLDLARQQRTQK